MTIETINAAEAARRMRKAGIKISPEVVRDGIQQKVFPFGDVIKSEHSIRCIVYVRLLEEWMERRSG